jgi:mono/diheme cytochrome c family protein
MMRSVLRLFACGVLAAAAGALFAYPLVAEAPQEGPPKGGHYDVKSAIALKPAIDRYCVTCHNAKLKTAGLSLEQMDPSLVGRDPETWEKVARKLRTNEMPPPGLPRPDRATYEQLASTLESALDAAAAADPRPGRVAIHRLNRTEYTNAIRDLLALDIDGRALLAADEPDQQGFDNVAGVLSVSPRLLENYMTAASTISRLAVGDATISPVEDTVRIPTATTQDDRASDDLPFGSRGGVAISYHFPLDGDYQIKVVLKRQLYLYLIGMGEPHQIDVRLDGALLKRFTIGGGGKGMTAPESFAGNTQGEPQWEEYMHTADAGLVVRVPVTAGTHRVGVSFVRRHWEPEGVLQPPQRGFARTTNELYFGNPSVDNVSIAGPLMVREIKDSPARRKVFVCRPASAAQEEPCARRILSTLARRAYRGPVSDNDVTMLMSFYRAGRAEGGFDAGIQQGLRRILASPRFVFRIEREPTSTGKAGASEGWSGPAGAYRVTDLDLASRLSFFLWSSIPDEELLAVATKGTLSDRSVLERQVRRMLADPRSQALVDNFASQWLTIGKLSGVVPDVDAYPEFDENLREAFRQETRMFIASQLREDRGVTELVTANYSFVNERLARHYRIPNVYGSHFRRVTFSDGVRGGLLGQGSILTVTSYPNRTSPVLRGRWLLDNVLGAPPPPPPPDIPLLNEGGADTKTMSIRQQMEAHRKNPSCAVCHVRMDPLGFSLEHFDALGKWRSSSDGIAVDASGALPDGTRFEGIAGLRQLIASHQEDFARTFTQKLLAYALGRSLEARDQAAVRRITREAAGSGYRWSSIIVGVATSTPFTTSTSQVSQARAGSTTTAP